jgi:choline dehydrogenase-like flavoprotein
MHIVDGREVETTLERECDVAVVGSGPAGATAARDLARQGARVVVLEQGPWIHPDEFPDDMYSALSMMFREMAASLTDSWPPIPILQGVAVGGSSVMNGAICWRLPREVYDEWAERDPAFREDNPWETLQADFDAIEAELDIGPTDNHAAGRHNELFAEGAEALGYEHKPTDLNVKNNCQHSLRGCPQGNRMSMERTYLPEMCEAGGEIISSATVKWIDRENGRATGVRAVTPAGGDVVVRADRAVVMAASAIQTPALLQFNGIDHGPVGEHLQSHPGASVVGRFDESVKMWTGATQGHETLELKGEGIKMETLGYNPTLATMRMDAIGRDLTREIERLDQWMNGGAAVRAEAHGTVRARANGEATVSYVPTERDFRKLRKGSAVLGEILLEAGAEEVSLGAPGWENVDSREEIEQFKTEGPTNPESFELILSHLFGTCRMGSDPANNVVDTDFEHHGVDRLYVADSSVFPSNTGVNPQLSIIALARQCARHIAA